MPRVWALDKPMELTCWNLSPCQGSCLNSGFKFQPNVITPRGHG